MKRVILYSIKQYHHVNTSIQLKHLVIKQLLLTTDVLAVSSQVSQVYVKWHSTTQWSMAPWLAGAMIDDYVTLTN